MLTTIMLSMSRTGFAHSEIVATYIIESYDGAYYLRAMLEKKHLTMALVHEGDCPSAQMMSVCGSKYLLEHLSLSSNAGEIPLEKQAMEMEKDYVIFTYRLDAEVQAGSKIRLTSDYMFYYNDHAILRALISHENSGERPQSLTLRPSRTHIEFTTP